MTEFHIVRRLKSCLHCETVEVSLMRQQSVRETKLCTITELIGTLGKLLDKNTLINPSECAINCDDPDEGESDGKLSTDNLNAFDSIYIDDIGRYSDTAVYILMIYKIMRYIYMLRKSCTVNTGGIDECNFAPS